MAAQPDPVADTIRAAEMELERELEIAVAKPMLEEMNQAPVAAAQESFRPASRLFSQPAEAAPAYQPAAQQHVEPSFTQSTYAQPARQPVQAQDTAPAYVQPQSRVEPSLMASVRAESEMSRMPKVEDFPPVVKAEMELRASGQTAQAEERGPMGLLKRLTSSLGRKEEETVPSDLTSGAPSASSQQRRALSPEASLYAPRRGNLDDQGRPVPATQKSQESEEFDIPAFLRRQTN
jgi:cell division protein FtsZ